MVGSLEQLDYVKVGCSRYVNPTYRLRELQCGNPFQLHLWGLFQTKQNLLETERWVHYKLKNLSFRGEWFKGNPKEIAETVGNLIKNYNPNKCKIEKEVTND